MYERYCELRDSLGYRDSDVAKGTGITKSTFSDWKNGRSIPKDEKLKKIALFLDTSVDYLRYGDQAPQYYLMSGEEKEGGEKYYLNDETAKMAQEIFDNKELRMLFDAARDAAPEDLEAAHTMILALKRKERKNIDD